MTAQSLEQHPAHLGLGASVVVEPAFGGGLDWYAAYGERHAEDGAEGRLVSLHRFDAPWDSWEMHPAGHELVLCIAGEITLIQEDVEGARTSLVLRTGQYAVNPPGVWHTADVSAPASVVFITAGYGTEHRPR